MELKDASIDDLFKELCRRANFKDDNSPELKPNSAGGKKLSHADECKIDKTKPLGAVVISVLLPDTAPDAKPEDRMHLMASIGDMYECLKLTEHAAGKIYRNIQVVEEERRIEKGPLDVDAFKKMLGDG